MRNNRFVFAWRRFQNYSLRKKIVLIAGISLAALLLISLLTFVWFARDIADRERLMNRNNTGIRLLDEDGETFYTYGRVKEQEDVKLAAISDDVEKGLIASEDKDFYEHGGFSVRGIAGAVYDNVFLRDAKGRGGSTLTQQLVKNNLLTSDKNFLRKYQELSIAVAVDHSYSKDDILEMYLNSVYFGEGAFGIGPAAKAYFNKTPQDLSLAESTMLIGILPAPSAYSPISGDPAKAKQQQERVLDHMLEEGYIDQAARDAALAQPLAYNPNPTAATNEHAEHFTQMILAELNERYGEERVARSGFQVTTSLELDWQKAAEEQVQARVRQLTAQGGSNAGLVAIDPRSGAIKALVGSADWNNEEFGKVNMATTPRQPGSSFKPIYFTEAMAKKIITPATILQDKPKTFGTYKPENYDFKYQGDITARRALAQSRNLTAIQVMEQLGVQQSIDAAQQIGIDTIEDTPEQYGLALALGTAEATLLDMTNAYATYANEGIQNEPFTITSIEDKFGKRIYNHREQAEEVQTREASYLISSILSDPLARAPTFNSLNIPNRTVAVKTGTTNDNKDAWTIGYTPSIAVGVWVGNNANRPMSGVAGAGGAGPIWRGTMQRILQDTPAEAFSVPNGIVQMHVCANNGLRAASTGAGTYAEYFIKGTAPTASCNEPRQDDKDKNKKKDDKKDEEESRGRDEEEEIIDEDDPTVTPTPPTPSPTPTPTPGTSACSDGKDNDGDRLVDAADPGCTGPTDNSEFNAQTTPPPPTTEGGRGAETPGTTGP